MDPTPFYPAGAPSYRPRARKSALIATLAGATCLILLLVAGIVCHVNVRRRAARRSTDGAAQSTPVDPSRRSWPGRTREREVEVEAGTAMQQSEKAAAATTTGPLSSCLPLFRRQHQPLATPRPSLFSRRHHQSPTTPRFSLVSRGQHQPPATPRFSLFSRRQHQSPTTPRFSLFSRRQSSPASPTSPWPLSAAREKGWPSPWPLSTPRSKAKARARADSGVSLPLSVDEMTNEMTTRARGYAGWPGGEPLVLGGCCVVQAYCVGGEEGGDGEREGEVETEGEAVGLGVDMGVGADDPGDPQHGGEDVGGGSGQGTPGFRL